MNIFEKSFGTTPDGKNIILFELNNANGIQAGIINYGGIVVFLKTPDRNGKLEDIVLGYDNLNSYIKDSSYFGALVGRYTNRIAKGKFILNGKTYNLTVNNNENHLHGGIAGFDKKVWEAERVQTENAVGIQLSLFSPHMEEGYPGNLKCEVTYLLTNNDELKIIYNAQTDMPTVISLTHHSYFNFSKSNRDILGHEIKIYADRYTPVTEDLIPLGIYESVEGTPFDFNNSMTIGARIDDEHIQLARGGGYDHNYVLNNQSGKLGIAAEVYDPISGRFMEVFTTKPGMQLYTGNFLDGTHTGKNGIVYDHRRGFCLEAQHFPDSPNQPSFPSVVLSPGETYSEATVYKFSAY